MDYKKIKLENERNSHVTKRLNRLSTWKFFTVIYRENVWRMFGFSILMLLCAAPMIAALFFGSMQNASLQQNLPVLGPFGFVTGSWIGIEDYYAQKVLENNILFGAIAVGASLVISLILSGGFAVIRDAFWTGKLSAVGVFRSMGKGIAANIGYALITSAVLAGGVYGLYVFYTWAVTAMPKWLAIVLLVLMCIVLLLVAVYLFIVCSVSVTYKQSVKNTLDDSWRLMWLNIFPNIFHFIVMLLPIGLYFLLSNTGGMFQMLIMVFIMMFGGLYFPLVWQTHMMKTFALFHPVEAKKKKQVHTNSVQRSEKYMAERAAKEAKNKQSQGKNAVKKKDRQPAAQEEPVTEVGEEEDDDIYAVPQDDDTAPDTQDELTDEVNRDGDKNGDSRGEDKKD